MLCAFDLIELDGEDLRRLPIEQRKRTLVKLMRRTRSGKAALRGANLIEAKLGGANLNDADLSWASGAGRVW